ncbi:uncharacterized protein LOC126841491 [Adelges cooleyi]|uniref:uncharacterized protein LOC126841491 n=1 Tax=Adelges cooleyi TaxID=133065 RepID=UPI00217F64B4|nr:uncharacterized protein LOC126841491 [Adelges cooleyi]
MLLKISLSFLFFILTVSCMNSERKRKATCLPELKTVEQLYDDTITENAFANCKKWAGIKDEETDGCIPIFLYYLYMGDNVNDWNFIGSYLDQYNQGYLRQNNNIDALIFSDLFKMHCQIKGTPIDGFANDRKAVTDRKEVNGQEVFEYFLNITRNRNATDRDNDLMWE